MQTSPLAQLIAPARLSSLPPAGILIIQSARLLAIARRREQDPLPLLADRLGDAGWAQHMARCVLLAGEVWPERFTLSPPCCGAMTHDEALLGDMAARAMAGDRRGYDAACRDLLNEDARDLLWRELRRAPVVQEPARRAPPPPD